MQKLINSNRQPPLYLLTLLLLLFLSKQDPTPAPEQEVEMVKNQITVLQGNSFYRIPEDYNSRFLTLTLIGQNKIEVQLQNNRNQILIAHQIELRNEDTTYILPVDMSSLSEMKGGRLKIRILEKRLAQFGIYAEIFENSFLNLDFNDMNEFKFISKFFDQLNLLFEIKEDLNEEDNYVIYFKIESFVTDFKINQEVDFFLNQSHDSFPTEQDF